MINETLNQVSEVKSKFQIRVGNELVNLIGTTAEFKDKLLKDSISLIKTSRRDWDWLTTSIIAKNPTNIVAVHKANSIAKRITRLENEVQTIVEASIADKQEIESLSLCPIGKETHSTLSSEEILNKAIENDFELFEIKMYEVLGKGSSDIVVPVLKELAKIHGYKLSKIPTK